MANPSSRGQLKQYALRQLGKPVIEINVDDGQLEDRLDEALQLYQEYHSDATIKTYFKMECPLYFLRPFQDCLLECVKSM